MSTNAPRILGREPALWAGFLNAAIYMLGAFAWHLTATQEGTLIAVASVLLGLIVAAITRDGLPAAILGLVKALLAVALAFRLRLDPDHQAVILSFAAAVAAMFIRTQVTAPVPPPATTPVAA